MKQEIFKHKWDNPELPGFSIIIPNFMRTRLLKKSLEAVNASIGLNNEFRISLYIVDGTPSDDENKDKVMKIVEEFSKEKEFPIYLLQELGGPSITNAKIEGAEYCKNDGNGIIIFVDTDIFVKDDTLVNCLEILKQNEYAAWVGRRSIWDGNGPKHGSLWKPEKILKSCNGHGTEVERDNMGRTEETVFISAIHGDFLCLYKEVYFKIGGYDVIFGNHGENVDLSIKCWRHGFPLVHDDSVVVYHSIDAPYSIMRKNETSKKRREIAIFSTPLKICYIYGTLNRPKEMEEFNQIVHYKWVKNVFKSASEDDIPPQLIYLLAQNIDTLIDRADLLIKSREMAYSTPFSQFMPYDIFNDLQLFRRCISEAPARLKEIRKQALK